MVQISTLTGSTHIEVLQKYVVDNGLDIGLLMMVMQIAVCLVTIKGNVVDGDKIMYVCGKYLQRSRPDSKMIQ